MPRSSHYPRFILTDVDDTLTWEGLLPADTLRALYRLNDAGIGVIPITGACAGWCDQMARTWPVSAVIGENGAFVIERDGRRLRWHDTQDEPTRARHRLRLSEVAGQLMHEVPGLAAARDNGYRRYDLALDHAQEVEPVAPADVRRALGLAHAAGAQATASSIHINLWLGDFSKRIAAARWLGSRHGMDEATCATDVVFVGDSTNDAQMFEAYPRSVGVANIRPHLPHLPRPPAEVTSAPGGFGFAEWVDRLLPC
jgi:HAD superfamily hydrolase (TIGR01484 family)